MGQGFQVASIPAPDPLCFHSAVLPTEVGSCFELGASLAPGGDCACVDIMNAGLLGQPAMLERRI